VITSFGDGVVVSGGREDVDGAAAASMAAVGCERFGGLVLMRVARHARGDTERRGRVTNWAPHGWLQERAGCCGG
jgi:hypothetical protein